LFSLSAAADEHDAHVEEEGRSPGAGGRAKWLAVAAAVILCLGGFAAWTLLKPSPDATAASGNADGAKTSAAAQPDASTTSNGVPAQPAASRDRAAASPPEPPAAVEAAPAVGSVQVVSPIVIQVSEKGQALGTSAAPVAVPAGRHVLDLSNEEVGYQATQVVDVRPGRVAKIVPALPRGAVNINATPWAEVLVDGQRIGETPLGNVQMTVGSHEVRFRHPQLGEQVRTVVVTTGAPGRLSVDMKQ